MGVKIGKQASPEFCFHVCGIDLTIAFFCKVNLFIIGYILNLVVMLQLVLVVNAIK